MISERFDSSLTPAATNPMIGIGLVELLVLVGIGSIVVIAVVLAVVRSSSSPEPGGPMAACPMCHQAVSPWAASCPHCGHPFQQQPR